MSHFKRCLKIAIIAIKEVEKIPVSVSKGFLESFTRLGEVRRNHGNVNNAIKALT
jgi:hypothetical protein